MRQFLDRVSQNDYKNEYNVALFDDITNSYFINQMIRLGRLQEHSQEILLIFTDDIIIICIIYWINIVSFLVYTVFIKSYSQWQRNGNYLSRFCLKKLSNS